MVLATSFYDLCTILIICSTFVFFSSKKTGKCKHESCPLCASCNNFYRPICFIIRSRLKIWFHKYFFVTSNPEPYLCIAWVSWITTTAVKFLRNKSLNISFSFHVVLQKSLQMASLSALKQKKFTNSLSWSTKMKTFENHRIRGASKTITTHSGVVHEQVTSLILNVLQNQITITRLKWTQYIDSVIVYI